MPEYVQVNGESFTIKYGLIFKNEKITNLTNLCDDQEEIELDWLAMVYDEYEKLIREYLRESEDKNETVDEMIKHERHLLNQAKKSVSICRILVK